ncbi:CinA family protein [Demequina sp. NBRC 110054]|uniref:CinA family protein n=1 Tax=Demequina sp. NBRC 110054 TaxID=1570343 RepID=UPI000A04EE92|nr:nicotinamide-nucleotide amidohydrolase family protein [Demequina sp. NBRC 110054]
MTSADEVVAQAAAGGVTLAFAESLTGGAVCSALVSVPGASQVLLGGIVSYTVEAKHALLGVPAELLDERGPVSEEVAIAMATGVRARLCSDIGVSTTGVAGPDPHDGKQPGTVWVGVATASGASAHKLALSGDRAAIRQAAVDRALDAALAATSEVSHA